jgi:ketosteroid isomerase-like protein
VGESSKTESRTNRAAAERLYAAFAEADAEGLLAVLAPDFRGVVSAGMPAGLGGTYEGPERMLQECWAQVFVKLDTRPVAEEYLATADEERMVVLGHYRGEARESGRPHEASFAHVLRFRDGRILELIQITDTQRWHEALAA